MSRLMMVPGPLGEPAKMTWVPDVPKGKSYAGQCHVDGVPDGAGCTTCGATCRRGKDGKIEYYSLPTPEHDRGRR